MCDYGQKIRRLVLLSLTVGQAYQAAAQQPASAAAPTSASDVAGVTAQQSAVFSTTTRYDSNVPRTNDLRPNPRGLERSDVRISPSFHVAYARNFGRHLAGLNADLGYDFYIKNTVLDRERISVNPFVNLDLPVCDVALLGGVSRRQSELGELVDVALDPAVALQNAQTRRRLNARLICGGAYGLRPTFEYDYNRGENSNPLRQRANFRSTRLQSGLSYSSPGLGDISVFATRTEIDFPDRITSTGGPAGFMTRGAGVQYRRAIGTRLNFDGTLSYIDLEPKSGNLPGRSGLNAAVSFILTATPRLQLSGVYSRAFTNSLTSNATYQIINIYALNATYAANDRLRLRAGASLSPRTFFYDVVPVGPFIGNQRRFDIFGGASYSLNDRVQLSLDGGYQSRRADLAFFDYDRYFISAGVSVSL